MRRPFASGHENVAMRCARNLLNETLKAFTNSESPPGTVTEGPLLPVRAYLGQGGVEQPAGLVARGREREPSILPRLRAARANITAYATQPSRQKLTRIPTRDLKSLVSCQRQEAGDSLGRGSVLNSPPAPHVAVGRCPSPSDSAFLICKWARLPALAGPQGSLTNTWPCCALVGLIHC